MAKLNPISGKNLSKILISLGFKLLRVKGSHYFYFNSATGKTATIPIHSNEDLGTGLLKKILRDIELSVQDFDDLRNN